ncbi:MAG TPA: isopentenyl-diphosphate Delta-isomerase [Gemmataceae bacterium]|nr:isopentenyl-diphosphate Delta-isomerase [Gemmataceae bacterium]
MSPIEMKQVGTVPPRQVILCDETGQPTGIADILAAHSGTGQLHLAFSVYVFSPDGQSILLQQRAAGKMLWPLAWANTCCSHPRVGETPIEAGRRRIKEELGIDCALQVGPAFVYRADDPAGRGVEHEYDILLIGTTNAVPVADPQEVAAWKWVELAVLQQDMRIHPERYSPWLHIGLPLAIANRLGEEAD